MTKRLASLTSMILLALGIAAFAGSALAGNGNGQGQGNGNDKGTTTQPAKGSAGQNSSTQAGVKPTNATAKGTTCSTGGGQGSSATCSATGTGAANASSAGKTDSSKKYGNGKTAAQIANSRGAPAGTQVYGPGNSQPHKVWDCRRQHWVDVHAVKSYSSASCTTQAQQPTSSETRTGPGAGATGATSSGGTNNSSHAANATGATKTRSGGVPGSTATGSGASAPKGKSPTGGVLGVTVSAGNSQPVGGVLGAIVSVGSGVLPFTGFPLWTAVLAALLLIVLGLALRRRGRATA